jgi:hypothetical protein
MARRRPSSGISRLLRIGLWAFTDVKQIVIVNKRILLEKFDTDKIKQRIIATIKQQTGRDLDLQGRIRLGLSLQPTLTIQGVASPTRRASRARRWPRPTGWT